MSPLELNKTPLLIICGPTLGLSRIHPCVCPRSSPCMRLDGANRVGRPHLLWHRSSQYCLFLQRAQRIIPSAVCPYTGHRTRLHPTNPPLFSFKSNNALSCEMPKSAPMSVHVLSVSIASCVCGLLVCVWVNQRSLNRTRRKIGIICSASFFLVKRGHRDIWSFMHC